MSKGIITNGLSGLYNIANTSCYINSVLQCLNSTKIMVEYLHDPDNFIKYIKTKYEDSIMCHLNVIFNTLWEENQIIKPKSFKILVQNLNPMFQDSVQNDCQEFLNFLFDKIHEESKSEKYMTVKIPKNIIEFDIEENNILKQIEKTNPRYDKFIEENFNLHVLNEYAKFTNKRYENNYSIINHHFTGTFFTKVTCKKCYHKSITFQPYNILTLPVPETLTTLEECLSQLVTNEELKDDNKYNCSKCNMHVEAIRTNNIFETPDILIVQLNRFKYIYSQNITQKNQTFVKFPEKINMSKYYSEYFEHDNNYMLYAVINHQGTLNTGHCYAYTKNLMNDKWYEFNDEHVVYVPEDKFQEEIVTKSAYILFYKKM